MISLKSWILTARPKTLLLSISGVLTGNALALTVNKFNPVIFLLTLLTAGSLQAISNFCNDYGDYSKGTDTERIGPKRAIHLNLINLQSLRRMIIILCAFTVFFGILLLYSAFGIEHLDLFLGFIVLGGVSILAATQYTLGKKPYGYIGLGDLSVFVFFGWVCVCGAYFLQTLEFSPWLLLPASTLGLFSAGVLNINNMRDADSDKLKGKITFSVLLGKSGSQIYHVIITVLPIILMIFYMAARQYPLTFILINAATVCLFIPELYIIVHSSIRKDYNRILGAHSLGIFLYAAFNFIGHAVIFG